MEILQEAGKVGEELDVNMRRIQEAEDAFLGVDMGLIKGVRDVWTEMVRRASISRESGARELELDAFEMGQQLGTEGAFAGVAVAAVERCVEGARCWGGRSWWQGWHEGGVQVCNMSENRFHDSTALPAEVVGLDSLPGIDSKQPLHIGLGHALE